MAHFCLEWAIIGIQGIFCPEHFLFQVCSFTVSEDMKRQFDTGNLSLGDELIKKKLHKSCKLWDPSATLLSSLFSGAL